MNELTQLQRKSLLLISRAQIWAFFATLLGVLSVYSILSFVKPTLTTLAILLLAIALSLGGTLLLIQIWWLHTIKKTILSPVKLLKLVLGNSVVLFIGILIWLLVINNLLSPVVVAILALVFFTYVQFVKQWDAK